MKRRLGLLLLVAVSFIAGVLADRAIAPATAGRREPAFQALDVLTEVYGHIRRNYVEPVREETLVYAAIDGMVRALDPHSEYLTPEAKAQFRQQNHGRFPGVGMEVGLRDGELLVIAPLPGAPAARAGVQAGDRLRAIDGRSTRGMTLGEAVRAVRGPAGSSVELQVQRGERPPFLVRIERAVVEVTPVEGELLGEGAALLRVRTFQRGTADAVREMFHRLRGEAGGELAGVVLDLRNNPGGLLSEAIEVADLFLDHGQIVSTRGRDGAAQRSFEATSLGTLPPVPLVALVNAGTASSAEIVVGALQASRRAVVVGTATFGKGSVQSLYDLSDGSGLKLTIAHYFTPDGRSIQARGIQPDVVVAAADALPAAVPEVAREADLAGRLANPTAEGTPGARARPTDVAVARALEVLRVAGIFSTREAQ